jgi:uncharacterized damage-inducible protein DinB
MRRNTSCRCSILAVLMLAAVPAAAHDVPAATAAAAEDGAPGFQSDVAADLERTGKKLVGLAEAIPADKYGWRPAEGVRTVSEVFVHTANANLLLPVAMGAAPAEGFTPPGDMPAVMAWMQEREAGTTAKDAVVAELRKSLDYAAAALGGLPTARLEENTQPLGFPASRRGYALVLLTHNHEHLGQAIAYARSIGVTPPWSEAAGSEGGDEAEDDGEAAEESESSY